LGDGSEIHPGHEAQIGPEIRSDIIIAGEGVEAPGLILAVNHQSVILKGLIRLVEAFGD